jgi:hypothetical protein
VHQAERTHIHDPERLTAPFLAGTSAILQAGPGCGPPLFHEVVAAAQKSSPITRRGDPQ